MDEKTGIEKRLAQAKRDRAMAKDTADVEIKSLEQQLAELDKPKLRHGDYGYYKDGGAGRLIVGMDVLDCRGKRMGARQFNGLYNITGNVWDDLKRNAEPLEEFTIKANRHHGGDEITVRPWTLCGGSTHDITFRCSTTGPNHPANEYAWSLEEVEDFHQKLGQLIATAKRRASVP